MEYAANTHQAAKVDGTIRRGRRVSYIFSAFDKLYIALTFLFSNSNGVRVWEAEVEIPAAYLVDRFNDELDGFYFSIPEGLLPLGYPMRRM